MIGRGLIKKLVAAMVAAGAAFVAVVAMGATIFYALMLVVPELAAAAITAALFALVSALVAAAYLGKGNSEEDVDEEESEGFGSRIVHLFRDRPMVGAVVALAGGWIFLRNPALATMVAAAVSERRHHRRRY